MILSINRNRSWTWRADLCLPGIVGEKRMDGEFGVGRCKIVHLEWMGNGFLPYSTGYCVQSLGLEHDGRWYGKKKRLYICIYIYIYCWVTSLYRGNWRNIINQLYFNNFFFFFFFLFLPFLGHMEVCKTNKIKPLNLNLIKIYH